MFSRIMMFLVLSILSCRTWSVCLEDEVEINERCVDRKKVHIIHSADRLQTFIDEAQKGDYIFLKSGHYEIESSQETGLLVTKKHDITLLGEDEVLIKTKRKDAPVLTIESSQNILIKNLSFTHDTKDRCDSPIIKLTNAKNIKISDSSLEGPGTEAVVIHSSHNIEISGGQAIKNTEGVFDIKDSRDITISNMTIEGNYNLGKVSQGILDIEKSQGILFSYNVVKNNKNAYFKKVNRSQNLEIEGNEFTNNGFSNYDINEVTPSEEQTGQVLWSESFTLHPQLPSFKLEFIGTWQERVANIQLIKLYQNIDRKEQTIQTIEGLDTHTLPDEQGKYFNIVDVNFDGYQDFFLTSSTEEKVYLFWLYDPTNNTFVQNNELNNISNPIIDKDKKQIVSSWKNSATSFGTNSYQFINGQFTLVRQESKELLEAGTYQWTVKVRQGNEMKMIEQRLIKEEHTSEFIQQFWQQLDQISHHHICTHEDNEIRFLYCHLKEFLAGFQPKLPMFVRGPHQEGQFHLEDRKDFGYYNEEFVLWLKEQWNVTSQIPQFKTWTEPLYQRYVRQLARTFYEVALQLKEYPEEFEQSKRNYLAKKTTSNCCNYPWFPSASIEGTPQAIMSAVAFWIRRSIDGTDQEWITGLRSLLEIYDQKFLSHLDDRSILHYQAHYNQVANIALPYCQSNKVVILSASQVFGYPGLNEALQEAHSGDSVWLCPGIYDEELHLEGQHHLSIYGKQVRLRRTYGDRPLITIKNSQFIQIAGLTLSLEKISEHSTCLRLTDSQHIYLRDLSIDNCGRFGMQLSQLDEVEITGSQFRGCQEALLIENVRDLLLKANYFIGNLQKNVSIPHKEDKEEFVFRNRWRDNNQIRAALQEQNDAFKLESLTMRAQQGDWVAQLMLSLYWNHENDTESFKWLFQAASQGYAKAQYQLGWMCHEGRAHCQALYWFQEAAQQGHLQAQNLLSHWYLEGKYTNQNFTQAAFWARQAAQQGDASAQNLLAGLYYEGKGLPQDWALVFYWVTLSAQGGYAQAQNNLGQLYYQGIGIAQDFHQAAYWFKQAAQQNHIDAQNNLIQMKKQLLIK